MRLSLVPSWGMVSQKSPPIQHAVRGGVEYRYEAVMAFGRSFELVFRGLSPAMTSKTPEPERTSADAGDRVVSRTKRNAPGTSLPPRTWPPVQIAIAGLNAYALSRDEAKTLTDTLHGTMVATDYFVVLSRSDMRTILQEQRFQRTDACDDSACLVEIGKILAVRKIIGGSVGKVGNTFSLALRMIDVESGATDVTVNRKLKAEPDQLLDLIEDAGRELALKYAKKTR